MSGLSVAAISVLLFLQNPGISTNDSTPGLLLQQARELSRDSRKRSEARKLAEQARSAATASNDAPTQAGAVLLLSRLATMSGQHAEAEVLATQAATLYRQLGNRRGQAEANLALGATLISQHKYDDGIAALSTGLTNLPEADLELRGRALHNLGSAHWSKGDAEAALRYAEQALSIRRQLKDDYGIAIGEQLLASIHWAQGDLQAAELRFQRSNRLWLELDQKANVANTHDGMGVVYLAMGDAARAAAQHQQALRIWTAIGSKAGQGQSLNNLGMAEHRRKHYRQAQTYLESALALLDKDPRASAYTLHNLGHLRADQGLHNAAIESLQQALVRSRQIGDTYSQSRSLYRLGVSRHALGKPAEANEALEAALSLQRSNGDRDAESLTLSALARIRRDAGELDKAASLARDAVEIIEQTRAALASPDLRATYLDAHHSQYDIWIETLLAQGKAAEAFDAAERARARSLLDSLADWTPQIDDLDARRLVERSVQLERQLRAATAARNANQLAALLAEYRETRSLLRASAAAGDYEPPEPWTTNRIQKRLLDDDNTALVAYWFGETTAHAWVVTRDSVHAHKLGAPTSIGASVARLMQALTARDVRPQGETLEIRRKRLQAASNTATATLAALAKSVLDPLQLTNSKRLLIIPDGALHSIPFGILPVRQRPLLAAYEIIVLPSASTLGQTRHSAATQWQSRKPVALIDPAYGDAYPALPYTAREAKAIPGVSLLQGPAAAVVALRAPVLRQAGLIHFGAHAVIDVERPALSGLVLSHSGVLRIHDIHDLRLKPGLVVLSACRSASGPELRGEGVMSLTRAFLYGGAARVIASLWSVDDQATAELMTRFYSNLYGKGQTPPAALRNAQLSMTTHPRWNAPEFWAAFQLHGEYR